LAGRSLLARFFLLRALMGGLLLDLRYAVRALARQKGVTATAVLTLALGIGATTAVFSIVHAVLIRPLRYPDADRLTILLTEFHDGGAVHRVPVAFPGDFLEWSAHARAFEGLGASVQGTVNLSGDGEPERLRRAAVTRALLDVLRVPPLLGRTFEEEEMRAEAAPVAMLGAGLWQRRFGGDPSIVGRTILLDRTPTTVVGVVPAGLAFPAGVEVWTPLSPSPGDRRNAYLQVVGRLAPSVTLAQAQAEMATIAARVEQAAVKKRGAGVAVMPLKDHIVGDVGRLLLVFGGAVAFVLLIACVNVASLLLARAETRRNEVAIRSALGATRWRLSRQLLCESLVLAAAGGACGALLAVWGAGLTVVLVPPGTVARLEEAAIDPAVLGFAAVVSLGTSLLFGLAPMLHVKPRGAPLASGADAGRGRVPGFGGLRVLVAGETALSVVLLVGAALLVRSFLRLSSVDPGFVSSHVLTLDISLPESPDANPEPALTFHERVLERLGRLSEVESAGAVNFLPLGGSLLRGDFAVEGLDAWPEGLLAAKPSVSPGYFRAMGVRLLQGRPFGPGDTRSAPGVAIVSVSLARRLWPGQDPLGRRVKIGIGGAPEREPWRTVVGVVADVRQTSLGDGPMPALYSPLAQAPLRFLVNDVTLVVRTAGEPAALATAVTREIHALDPSLPVTRVQPLESLVADSLASPRFRMTLLGAFAGVGVALAAIGVFGVLAYAVSRRTREIGVHMALGADRPRVVRLVVGQALGMTGVGLVLGLLGALALSRSLASFLYEVTPRDPLAYGLTSIALLAAALLASYGPARRAASIDPATALRTE
jgi:putative ABC transport system permease protein